jgi:hypothetical protein
LLTPLTQEVIHRQIRFLFPEQTQLFFQIPALGERFVELQRPLQLGELIVVRLSARVSSK